MISPHHHACARCAFPWACEAPNKPKAKRCMVDVAARVNKAGPFCLLCQHMTMAVRIAKIRRFTAPEFATAVNRCVMEEWE